MDLSTGPNLDLITVIVRDTRRSKDFYVEKLGFKLKTDAGEFVSILTPNKFPIGLQTPHKGHIHKVAPNSFQLEIYTTRWELELEQSDPFVEEFLTFVH